MNWRAHDAFNLHGRKYHMHLGNINAAQFYFVTYKKHNSEVNGYAYSRLIPMNKWVSLKVYIIESFENSVPPIQSRMWRLIFN